jgi:hypothetical protein
MCLNSNKAKQRLISLVMQHTVQLLPQKKMLYLKEEDAVTIILYSIESFLPGEVFLIAHKVRLFLCGSLLLLRRFYHF